MTTLLVVDDEFDLVAALEMLLSMDGFGVMTAEDGRDALEKATEHRPDLIITDKMMPRMDGLELCRSLRAQPETAAIPIILISAIRMDRIDADGLYDIALHKPARFDALREAIATLLDSRR